MAKRTANTELNHDNWDNEEEPEEAGIFKQAPKDVLKDRVIKKAKRRGTQEGSSGPSVFASFGGFKSTASASAAPSFDFVKSSSNGSNPTATPFSFASPLAEKKTTTSSESLSTPPAAGFSFGSNKNGATSSETGSGGFTFGNSASKPTSAGFTFGSQDKSATPSAGFTFGKASASSDAPSIGSSTLPTFGSFGAKPAPEKATFTFGSKSTDPEKPKEEKKADKKPEEEKTEGTPLSQLSQFKSSSGGKWTCSECMVPNNADQDKCVCCTAAKPGGAKTSADPKPLSTLTQFKPTGKWTCDGCMVQNDADKNKCVCCETAKPGAPQEEKKKEPSGFISMNPGGGFKFGGAGSTSSTPASSGFKFGSQSTPTTEPKKDQPSGFKFGASDSTATPTSGMKFGTPVVEKKETATPSKGGTKSKEYLSHLKALNTQVSDWIKTHVDKNPLVILTPIFKDYEKHLKEITDKYDKPKATFGNDSTPKLDSKPKPTFDSSSLGSDSKRKPAFGIDSTPKASFDPSPKKFDLPPSKVTFGDSSQPAPDKPLLGAVFGSGPEKTAPPPAKKDADATAPATGSSTFSFGSASASASKFSFGSTTTESSSATSGFSFGTGGSASKGFSFGTNAGTFGSSAPASTPASSEAKADEPEGDEPPKVEVKTVEEDDAKYSVRCKLYYKKEKEFVEKGLGMLHLKDVDGGKTQLLVRAETNLGNILLNIFVTDKMSLNKRGNNMTFVCVPNPPIPGMDGPITMLIKVKNADIATELEEKIKEAAKA